MSAKFILSAVFLLLIAFPPLQAQEQPPIKIRPVASGQIILAAADVQPATPEKPKELADAIKTFNQVLWDDLSFSGFFTMAPRGFYPPQPIVRPDVDINYDAWSSLPFTVNFLTTGTLSFEGGVLRAEVKVYDMQQRKWSGIGRGFVGDLSQVRTIAHWWADEIVYQLTAGASKGIASTRIAYCSRKGNAKEIYIMDYDGYNPQEFTRNGSLNLFPNWAPDNSKLAFSSFRSGKPEINIYSVIDGSRIRFQEFYSLALAPAISPDGTEIAFGSRSTRPFGDTEVFISKLDGSNRRNITNNPAADSSPTWAPSGKQLAFVSNREGRAGQIFICDADGSNIRRIVKEGGDADSPAWSPDGRWIAFHWKPHLSANYDLFVAEVSSGSIRQLTSNSGSNEYPTWAPDSRHVAFQSNRSGTNQIYIMSLEDLEPKMITRQGNNTSPAWSGHYSRNAGK